MSKNNTSNNNLKGEILKHRVRFLVEVVIVFFGIFFFLFVLNLILYIFIVPTSILYGPLYYLFRAISITIAIPLFLYLTDYILGWSKNNDNQEVRKNPALSHLKLLKITKNNFKYQLLYGILLLFLVFIPLDFIFYLIPGMLGYSIDSLATSSITHQYLISQDYLVFLISVILIQTSVAYFEEILVRGLLAKRGDDYFNKMSAVIISSVYFGLGHLAYLLLPISSSYPIWFPIIWFLQALFVGIILGIFFLRRKWLFPVIFSHALNNIISANALWFWNNTGDFLTISLYQYLPLLIIGIIIFILQYSRIKEAINNGLVEFRSYFQNDERIRETKGDKAVRIISDLFIGAIIFIIALFLI
jgi:membrane protease YdiL (CAAX protease family)